MALDEKEAVADPVYLPAAQPPFEVVKTDSTGFVLTSVTVATDVF